jgi:hypothetical protein
MRNILDKRCRKNQNIHFMFRTLFFLKLRRLWDNVEKYGGAREAADNVTVRRICFACWICKATRSHARAHARTRSHTHKYIIFIAFPRQQRFSNAPQYYVIGIVSFFLLFCVAIIFFCWLYKWHLRCWANTLTNTQWIKLFIQCYLYMIQPVLDVHRLLILPTHFI